MRIYKNISRNIGGKNAERIVDNKAFMTALIENLKCCPNYVERGSYTDDDIDEAFAATIIQAFGYDAEEYGFDWFQ